MTYGITILNNDNRVQIDENYSGFYPTTNIASSAAFASLYPTPGSDIIAARPVGTTGDRFGVTFSSATTELYNPATNAFYWGGRGNNATVTEKQPQVPYPITNGYKYYTLRKYSDNISANSGYGLGVYSSTGQTLFSSAAREKNLQIVSIGVLPTHPLQFVSTGSPWSNTGDLPNVVYYPSSTGEVNDLDKHYCVLNSANTNLSEVLLNFGYGSTSFYYHFGVLYEYIWTGPTSGRIKIHSFWKSEYLWSPYGQFTYVIMKELG